MNSDDPTPNQPDLETLWQFAGQGLRSSDFNTAMVHLYRGELTRSNVWRSRLDATTNWAVITTGATLSFAFSSPQNTPIVLIINTLLVLLFLFIEARRYRYYELWTYRVRIMEQNFFAGLLSPPFMPHSDWADRLTDSLNHPKFPISLLEAFGRRYRRNYGPIFLILAISWIMKIFIHPIETRSWLEFLDRAQIGPVSGWVVVITGVVFHAALIAIGILSADLQASTAEVLTGHPGIGGQVQRLWRNFMHEVLETELPRMPWSDPRKQMAFIISDKAEEIGKALLDDLHRGVTLLHGTGLYTGQDHGVLLCTFQAKQLASLKKSVKAIDPKAFLILTAVQDVHGSGFRPLEA
jgi:uncharacterized membrane protein